LGTDTSGGADSDTEDLNSAGGTIVVEGYIFDDSDVDIFAFTAHDNYLTDYGFEVTVDSVPNAVDIEVSIHLINTDGQLITDVLVMDDAGMGGAETLCISDAADATCWNSLYESGTWIVEISSSSGESCSDSYVLTIQD
jgi:hypothetical protein